MSTEPSTRQNTEASTSSSAWTMIVLLVAVATLGATFGSDHPVAPFVFSGAAIIGLIGVWFAVKDKDRLAAIVSAIATIGIVFLLIPWIQDFVSTRYPLISNILPWAIVVLLGAVLVFVLIVFFLRKRLSSTIDSPAPPAEPSPTPLPLGFHGAPELLEKKFVGREQEFRELDRAWDGMVSGESSHPTVGVIAWGGFGKTVLVRQWLWRWGFDRPDQTPPSSRQGMPGPRARDGNISMPEPNAGDSNDTPDALFWRSFQEGEGADAFALALVSYFSQDPQLEKLPPDSSQQMALLRQFMGDRRYLLVLDGLEVEQIKTRGDELGKLKSHFLRDLLREHAAGRLGTGLVVITSRLPLTDLAGENTYGALDLERRPLKDHEIRLLLKLEGVAQYSEAELQELIGVSGRHPLTLATIAGILETYNGGSATGWQQFDNEIFPPPEGDQNERHLWRVLAWTDGLLNAAEKRVMTTLAHFREPVKLQWLNHLLVPEAANVAGALRGEPPAKQEAVPEPDENASVEERLKWLLGQFESASGSAPTYTPEELRLPGSPMTGQALRRALEALVGLGLLRRDTDTYAMHGLVREHFRRQLARENQDGPMEIHTRLYRLYTAIIQPVWRPDGLEGLRPLYEAVYHGAQAGLHQETLDDVYFNRILRGTGPDGFYNTHELGAFEADLAAVANFFGQPWRGVSPKLSAPDRAWLLNEAAFGLRALGRLREAREPMGAGLEMAVEQEDWKNAAISAGNLSQLALTLGEIERAVQDGERGVEFADRSGDGFMREVTRTAHADALHQAGDRAAARALFQAAEDIQQEMQPEYPRLYSLQGFRYADLLLGGAERAAWRESVGWIRPPGRIHQETKAPEAGIAEVVEERWMRAGSAYPPYGSGAQAPIADCDRATERATQTLEWAERVGVSLLDIALNHLTLARAGLYRALLSGGGSCAVPPKAGDTQPLDTAPQTAVDTHLTAAVEGLREAGRSDYLPRSLLTRAWVRAVMGDSSGARSDLAEAWKIADNGSMGLFQADILLTRARLFFREDKEQAREDLRRARVLVEKHGYHRRDGELADAEEVVHGRHRK
uniref:AAA ATPase domain-containing protein n=1 Tax=Candidatus Kentrum sp. FW TaxID=2126338 RepID=A0A450S9N6_9GAMM|nr:MAG: hypothetical protein BECKFW1821B_GA0114236_100425 [Candidatus Kentron sp. FW]